MNDENTQTNSGPGFAKHPGYKITLSQPQQRVRIHLGGVCIVDTTQALVLEENTYSPVYYFPRADVQLTLMTRTDDTTHCPFKGHATYWSFAAAGQAFENVAWSYEDPYDEMLEIKDFIAFYPDRVDEILAESIN